MRSRPLAAILLTLAFSSAACQFIWGYDNFNDQPRGTGGSVVGDAGSDAGSDAESDAESDADGTANGLACEAGTDCQSGNCEPGDDGGTVCCAASCGMCQTCDGDGGACAPVPKGAPSPGCTGSVACDGAGSCKVQNGGACPNAGAVCLSGICMNGICCAVTCPACQSCKGDGSGCANLPAFSQDPRCMTMFNLCNGAGKCA